jgi:DNA-binding MarR family transcriptional regulator
MKPISTKTASSVRDGCLCLHVQRAARVITRQYDEAFRAVGLTSGQFSLLMSLSQPAGVSIGEFAQEMAMDRTTLTAYLKPLTEKKFVTIEPDPEDGRGRIISITAKGTAQLNAALPIWRNVQKSAIQRISNTASSTLLASLRELSA